MTTSTLPSPRGLPALADGLGIDGDIKLAVQDIECRMADGGANYATETLKTNGIDAIGGLSPTVIWLHKPILVGAFCLGLCQIPFILNLFISIKKGKKVESDNPWQATTLEWQTPTPPPHGNFDHPPTVHRGPYDYSVPGAPKDFTPQNQA